MKSKDIGGDAYTLGTKLGRILYKIALLFLYIFSIFQRENWFQTDIKIHARR